MTQQLQPSPATCPAVPCGQRTQSHYAQCGIAVLFLLPYSLSLSIPARSCLVFFHVRFLPGSWSNVFSFF
eukprot:1578795-Amphidinium_carterae.1